MKITLKDNEVAEVPRGTTVLKLAEGISASLAKNVICGRVNGKLVDVNSTINKNCKIEIITKKHDEALIVLRRSAGEILAHAVKTAYPSVKLAGCGIEGNNFYYDFDFKTAFSTENLALIEDEMKKIIRANFYFERSVISKDEAIAILEDTTETFKLEQVGLSEQSFLTLYKEGDFSDICEGPLVLSTSFIKAFKLLSVEQVYWQNDSSNKKLTRIYGTAFFSQAELKKYLYTLAESSRRNHLKIGKELDLFVSSTENDTSGLVYWKQNGVNLINTLIGFERNLQNEYGYTEISSPILVSVESEDGKEPSFKTDSEMAVKTKNCLQSAIYYKDKPRDVKDLPLRLSCYDILHRDEENDKLNGLFKLKEFRQDDAHIFVALEQLDAELKNIFELTEKVYKAFGIKYKAELILNTKEVKKNDDSAFVLSTIIEFLNKKFGEGCYKISVNEANPETRIVLVLKDVLNREWKTGVFKFDLNYAKINDLFYENSLGQSKCPLLIHRTIYGSIERFIGLILEHFNGDLPFWVAPVQVGIAYESLKCKPYAERIFKFLNAINIRTKLSLSVGTTKPIKELQQLKVPFVFVIGNEETKSKTISALIRNDGKFEQIDAKLVAEKLNELNTSRSLNLINHFKK